MERVDVVADDTPASLDRLVLVADRAGACGGGVVLVQSTSSCGGGDVGMGGGDRYVIWALLVGIGGGGRSGVGVPVNEVDIICPPGCCCCCW